MLSFKGMGNSFHLFTAGQQGSGRTFGTGNIAVSSWKKYNLPQKNFTENTTFEQKIGRTFEEQRETLSRQHEGRALQKRVWPTHLRKYTGTSAVRTMSPFPLKALSPSWWSYSQNTHAFLRLSQVSEKFCQLQQIAPSGSFKQLVS